MTVFQTELIYYILLLTILNVWPLHLDWKRKVHKQEAYNSEFSLEEGQKYSRVLLVTHLNLFIQKILISPFFGELPVNTQNSSRILFKRSEHLVVCTIHSIQRKESIVFFIHKFISGNRYSNGLGTWLVELMATARAANPAPMTGLNKSANVQMRGQSKPPGHGFFANALESGVPKKMTSIPQTSAGIK